MPAVKPPNLSDPVATGTWLSLCYSARMHKGLSRNAKMAGDIPLARYHHGYEEGIMKAMKVIVEKFGSEKNVKKQDSKCQCP